MWLCMLSSTLSVKAKKALVLLRISYCDFNFKARYRRTGIVVVIKQCFKDKTLWCGCRLSNMDTHELSFKYLSLFNPICSHERAVLVNRGPLVTSHRSDLCVRSLSRLWWCGALSVHLLDVKSLFFLSVSWGASQLCQFWSVSRPPGRSVCWLVSMCVRVLCMHSFGCLHVKIQQFNESSKDTKTSETPWLKQEGELTTAQFDLFSL